MTVGVRRFRLRLEYDGTDFAGFQFQAGLRSVQEVLETAVASATGQFSRVHGSGRTDSGVHALGQEVHFDSKTTLEPDRLSLALNALLPSDVSVRRCREVGSGFHSRFDATGRLYRYWVWQGPVRSAVYDRYVWHVRQSLDLDAMRCVAEELVGCRDFATFGRPSAPGRSTVRCVRSLRLEPRGRLLVVWVEGNAFLRHMVRGLVGTMILAGRGKLDPREVAARRDSCDPQCCPPIAPAKGLCLFRVNYAGRRIVDV